MIIQINKIIMYKKIKIFNKKLPKNKKIIMMNNIQFNIKLINNIQQIMNNTYKIMINN